MRGKTLELVIVLPKERRGRQPIVKTVLIQPHSDNILSQFRHITSIDDVQRLMTKGFGNSTTSSTRPFVILNSHHSFMMSVSEGQARLKVCALAASNALKKGVPVDDVTTQGNWSSSTIVEGYYRLSRSIASNFTSTLLPSHLDSQIESLGGGRIMTSDVE
ncbi:MAG: hypothetical protein BYD32DRAFT_482050 [Podila humilis]|nr:MAG: hypothetical protein BYD32DRAFT_482050 [Podila humilis]